MSSDSPALARSARARYYYERLQNAFRSEAIHMKAYQTDEQELMTVVTGWLKDALGPGADFGNLRVEPVTDDEFYFCYIKDNTGREYRFRVFWRFDDNCALDPVVIDYDTGMRVRSPEKIRGRED